MFLYRVLCGAGGEGWGVSETALDRKKIKKLYEKHNAYVHHLVIYGTMREFIAAKILPACERNVQTRERERERDTANMFYNF